MRATKDNLIHLFEPHGHKPSPSRLRRDGGATPSQRPNNAEAAGTRLTLVKGQSIFSEGQAAGLFYKVATGVVRTYIILADGRRQITGFHLAGDIFGLEPDAQHRFSASALCDVTVVAFKRTDLDLLLASDSAFRAEILSSLMASLERAQTQLVLMGRKTAREKVAQFLHDLAHRASKSETASLALRRSDIADFLGMSRETACRAISQLTCDGAIEVKGPSLEVRHEPDDHRTAARDRLHA